MLCTVIETRLVLISCRIHADFIFSLNCTMFCTVIEIRLVLNSCRIHADFIFTLNFHNALCNILHHNGVEFMLNSSKSLKSIRFLTTLAVFCEKSQTVFLIVYNMNNPIIANLGTFHGFA